MQIPEPVVLCCAVCCAVLQESDIVRKLQANRASTTDMSNNTVNVGDYVTILDAAAAAKAGPGSRKEKGGEGMLMLGQCRVLGRFTCDA